MTRDKWSWGVGDSSQWLPTGNGKPMSWHFMAKPGNGNGMAMGWSTDGNGMAMEWQGH